MNCFMKLSGYSLLLLCLVACNQGVTEVEEEDEADGLQYAMEQEFRMTRDPHLNVVPRERLVAARTYMESLINSGTASRTEALTWQERGPNNIGGRTRAMIIDKRDASGNTVFAGSVSGGMFKTTNFTAATPVWTAVNDMLPNLAITAMVQDNANMNIMYAGTGEGWFNIDAVVGNGIYKSTDGGTTWNVLPSTIAVLPGPPVEIRTFEYVQDLAIDNNGALYASLRNLRSTSRGVQRSTDGGATWTQVLGAPLINPTTGLAFATGRAADLEVASNGDVYASLGLVGAAVTNRSIVMKSSFASFGANTGALGNWTDITPITPTVTQRTEIIIAPSDPQRVYLLMQDSATDEVKNIFRSTNAGSSWTTLGTATALNGGAAQTWYNLIGAVDPNNPDIVVVGGLHLAKTTNGGDSWTTISSNAVVHVDQHFLQFIGSTRLIVGNDGGIYQTENFTATSPFWVIRNNGFNVTQFYGVDFHPTNANYFIAGAQDNGTQRFSAPGMNTTLPVVGGDGGFCHVDQNEPNIQVGANFGSRYNISNDGFGSFSAKDFNPNPNILGQFINPTDYDDAANLFYAGGNVATYTFINNLVPASGATLNTRSIPIMGGRALTAVKVDPFAANTIWVGATAETVNSLPMILKISNATDASPTVISTATLGTDQNAYVSSIDVDPANPNHIIATISNFGTANVYESVNGGTSFTNVEGNLPDMPVRWALFAPANAQLNGATGGNGGVLLGTELGVWTTSLLAGAATQWMPNNDGLANVRTDMLKLRTSDNTVVAATHGRGLYTTILPTVVTGLPNVPITKDFIKYIFTDNDQLNIVTGTLQTKNISIQLFNMQGQELYKSKNNYQNTSINLSSYQDGVYILRVIGDKKENFVQQFVKR